VGREPAPLLEAIAATLYDVAPGVDGRVARQGTTAPRRLPYALILSLKDRVRDLPLAQPLATTPAHIHSCALYHSD